MDRITVSLEEEQISMIESLSGDGRPYDSKSDCMRDIIREFKKNRDHEQEIEELQQEITSLENRLEESRRRERARDTTNEEIAQLRQDIEQEQRSNDAPFFVKWYRWYRDR
jgi:Arc/MetJ-type ribon-helix-helix transcriptional regulator